jgi:hypothetical protein
VPQQKLLDDLREDLAKGHVLLVVGTGVSIQASGNHPCANWRGLILDGIDHCAQTNLLTEAAAALLRDQLDVRDVKKMVEVAQTISAILGAPGGEFRRWLRESVGRLPLSNGDIIETIHALGTPIATTNYDDLLTRGRSIEPVPWTDVASAHEIIRGDREDILHFHGYYEHPDSVILGTRSYDKLLASRGAQAIQQALVAKSTLLFIGCGDGLTDPNFASLLEWSAATFGSSLYRHYCLCRNSEQDELQKRYPPNKRLFYVAYGDHYDDLAPFLRKELVPAGKSRKPAMANLPNPGHCIGRVKEVDEAVSSLLAYKPQALPILGGLGMGKTTIALTALHDRRVASRFGARRFFVRCNGLKTRTELAAAMAQALGVSITPNAEQAVRAALAGRPAALVLDDVETPLDAGATDLTQLISDLAAIESLALVVTTPGHKRPADIPWRSTIEAKRLALPLAREAFVAISGKPQFATDPDLDWLLGVLDGMPLAISLMARYSEPYESLEPVWLNWQTKRAAMLKDAKSAANVTNLAVCYQLSLEAACVDELSQTGFVESSVEEPIRSLERNLTEHNRRVLQQRTYSTYAPRFYRDRADLSSRVTEFLASDKSVMTLVGKAGTGKSFFVANLAKPTCLPEKFLLWIHDCGGLTWPWGRGLRNTILETITDSGDVKDLELLLEHTDCKLLLVFDALNEAPRRAEFIQELASFIHSCSSPRVKLLLTCRLPAWNTIRRHLAVPMDRQFQAGGMYGSAAIDIFGAKDSEEAYRLYQQAYHIPTAFSDLTIQVRQFLAHPLFLKLACDAFEGRELPRVLALHEVFAAYVRKCLGQQGAQGREYAVLERAVRLMNDYARREIEVTLLQNDDTIRAEVVAENETSAYAHLLDEGLLTQVTRLESLLRTADVVFVTYERVFEFLLAEIVIGSVTAMDIARHLEIIRERSFPQLRGALELALSFSIMRGKADATLLIQLARLDRPDSRQFLSEVIQTVHESGHPSMAIAILNSLSHDRAVESKLVAAQVAYQLALDDRLVELALSDDPVLRDRAAFYLYAYWNRKRLSGDLSAAYRPLRALRNKIRILYVPQSRAALSALVTLCINLALHVIDDPESLKPLVSIMQDVVRSVPGLGTNPGKGGILRFASNHTASIVIDLMAKILSRVMVKERVLQGIFDDEKSKRALLDVGSLITLDDLAGNEEKVLRLLTWNHPAIGFSSRSVLTRHVFLDSRKSLPVLEYFLIREELPLVVRINILHAMIYGTAASILHAKPVEEETIELLEGWTEQIWLEGTPEGDPQSWSIATRDVATACRNLFFGVSFIDATRQREMGRTNGSRFAGRISHGGTTEPARVQMVLRALESLGYQGFVEYALATIVDPEFSTMWQNTAREYGLRTLANLRSVFQEEVDEILQDAPEMRDLWDAVRAHGGVPETGDIWEMSYEVWVMVATAVDDTLMKISGLALLDLVQSSKPPEFIKKLIRTLIAILFDPERIDIAHIQYGFAHDENWDLFEALDIPRHLVTVKPEVHEYYREICRNCVARLGRGILYDEL